MLKVSNIEVFYMKMIRVLKGVSLEVPDGSIVALLGANGARKTTPLKANMRASSSASCLSRSHYQRGSTMNPVLSSKAIVSLDPNFL